MSDYVNMQNLQEQLKSNPTSVSDSEIIQGIVSYNERLQTNCDSAARGLFAAVSPFIVARPHLLSELLKYPLRPLYYLGIDTADGIIDWLHDLCKKPVDGTLWWGGLAPTTDVDLFVRTIADHRETIQRLLDDPQMMYEEKT
jgi:hypothetical protein